MKKFICFGNAKIKQQMYTMYILALLIPILMIGIYLIVNTDKLLNQYYSDLLEADNLRVRSAFTEVTTHAYSISEDVCYDSEIKKLLSQVYQNNMSFQQKVNENSEMDNLLYSNRDIQSITIYTNNQSIINYKQYKYATEDIQESEWYQHALQQTNAFWYSMKKESGYGKKAWGMCLVRNMTLPDEKYDAVVVIEISDEYIRSKIDSSIIDAVSIDDSGIIYSSKTDWYGKEQVLEIDAKDRYYTYKGTLEIQGKKYFANLSTTHLYRTSSRLYVCTLNDTAYENILRIISTCALIILIAVFLPAILLVLFTDYFTNRVGLLRKEMHKASNKEYDIIPTFQGKDELAEAFQDLQRMVQHIKQNEADVYEAKLNEKELRNEQQIVEYKMLASQINPHFLYNALETIRMKALMSGDTEVANAIKTLGKTLRYVLENTGISYTTLQKEWNHIENYLSIQKLRFNDRVNYSLKVEEGLELDKIMILPLLLQPIVENAVVHGLEAVEENGQISVDISLKDKEHLLISVSDNGHGMDAQTLENLKEKLQTPNLKLSSSIGLYNIVQRVKLLYGKEFGMVIESKEEQGTTVTLLLPYMTNENP